MQDYSKEIERNKGEMAQLRRRIQEREQAQSGTVPAGPIAGRSALEDSGRASEAGEVRGEGGGAED
jgi:hypothetical protein